MKKKRKKQRRKKKKKKKKKTIAITQSFFRKGYNATFLLMCMPVYIPGWPAGLLASGRRIRIA